LDRTLGTRQLTFYGIGTMMGAGIYVLVGKVAGVAGMYGPCAFLLAAVLAGLTAWSYAELSTRYPKSGGEVVYVQRAFRRKALSALVGWSVIATGVVSASAILRGFVGYLDVFVVVPHGLAIAAVVLLFFLIAILGVRRSLDLIGAITVLEVLGLLVVIALAGDALGTIGQRAHELVPTTFDPDTTVPILSGAFLAFFAFIGFEDLANVAEEAKDPSRSLPKAILYSLVVTTVLYVAISLVAVLSLPMERLVASEAPLAEILAPRGPRYVLFISAISLVAVVNGALAQIIMSARVLFGMAEEGMAPRLFGRVLPSQRTPMWATALVCVVILVLATSFPVTELAAITSTIILFVFTLVNLALVRIKVLHPHANGAVRTPLLVPVLGFLCSLALLLYRAAQW
jgi:amino acid transporter